MYNKQPKNRKTEYVAIPTNQIRSLIQPYNGIITQPFSLGSKAVSKRTQPRRSTQYYKDIQALGINDSVAIRSKVFPKILEGL
jgi:hypothetical protein